MRLSVGLGSFGENLKFLAFIDATRKTKDYKMYSIKTIGSIRAPAASGSFRQSVVTHAHFWIHLLFAPKSICCLHKKKHCWRTTSEGWMANSDNNDGLSPPAGANTKR